MKPQMNPARPSRSPKTKLQGTAETRCSQSQEVGSFLRGHRVSAVEMRPEEFAQMNKAFRDSSADKTCPSAEVLGRNGAGQASRLSPYSRNSFGIWDGCIREDS